MVNLDDPTVQAAFVVGVTAIVAGLVGGFVGGRGATNVARLNIQDAARARQEARDDAHQARFQGDTRDAAARLLQAASIHRIQLRDEAFWRHNSAQAPWPLRAKPQVDRLDTLASDELQVAAMTVETAARALDLVAALVRMDKFAVESDWDSGVDPQGHVRPMDDAEYAAFTDATASVSTLSPYSSTKFVKKSASNRGPNPSPREIDAHSLTAGSCPAMSPAQP